MTNTVQVAPPAGLADPVADNNASTDTTLIEPNGIFSDDFESEGTGLHVPTAKHAQAKSRRL